MQSGAEHAATFSFLKDKLEICFKDEYRYDRTVYWYYDAILKEKPWQNGKTMVTYTGYPEQTIVTASREFIAELEERVTRQDSRLLIKTLGRSLPLIRVLFIVLILLVAVYFWVVPYLAVRLAGKVPVSYEENLGQAMYNAMKTGFKIDEKRTAYINDFFKELNILSPYPVYITVVQGGMLNAFALPGGNIVVYDGMLEGMDNYDELAALLSHEFTHVQNRHSTKSLFRQMGHSMIFDIVLGNTSGIATTIIRHADNLKNLSYSRSLEKEADLEGLRTLAARKIDCNGFARLFAMLKKQSKGALLSEWMSSHPDLDKRMEYTLHDPAFNKNGFAENETLKNIFRNIKTGASF